MAVDLITEVGRIGLWIQAVGLVVVIWIVVQVITLFYNRKRRLLLESIDTRLLAVEKKLDRVLLRK